MRRLATSIRLRAARCAREDSGFTLVELLIAAGMSLLIGASALALMEASTPLSNAEYMRQTSISEGRASLQRMVRELRGATSINSTAGNVVDFNANTNAGPKRIVYACDDSATVVGLRSCTRYVGTVGGSVGATGQLVIDRVVNGTTSQPVFRYSPDRIRPTRVTVQIVLPSRAESPVGYNHRIVINDAAFLRNIDLLGT